MTNEMDETTAQIVPLKEVTYEQFKEFLDSLDEEKKTWSLDLQTMKDDKEFYDSVVYVVVCVYDKEVIGLCNCHGPVVWERVYENDIFPKIIEVSFVVKKDYQSQGIGSTLLKRAEWDAKIEGINYITAKHYKNNIASHKAFLKAEYKEWTIDKIPIGDGSGKYFHRKEDDGAWDWKIKEIG